MWAARGDDAEAWLGVYALDFLDRRRAKLSRAGRRARARPRLAARASSQATNTLDTHPRSMASMSWRGTRGEPDRSALLLRHQPDAEGHRAFGGAPLTALRWRSNGDLRARLGLRPRRINCCWRLANRPLFGDYDNTDYYGSPLRDMPGAYPRGGERRQRADARLSRPRSMGRQNADSDDAGKGLDAARGRRAHPAAGHRSPFRTMASRAVARDHAVTLRPTTRSSPGAIASRNKGDARRVAKRPRSKACPRRRCRPPRKASRSSETYLDARRRSRPISRKLKQNDAADREARGQMPNCTTGRSGCESTCCPQASRSKAGHGRQGRQDRLSLARQSARLATDGSARRPLRRLVRVGDPETPVHRIDRGRQGQGAAGATITSPMSRAR